MRVRAIFASPLLHFFVLGGLVFALFSVMNPQSAESSTENRVVLTEEGAQRLIDQFTSTWKRPPTALELEGLIQDWTEEEVLVREASALGLDQGDAMIRNRLRQKILFLAEAPVASAIPDEPELEAFYQSNADQFMRPGTLSFDQVRLPEGWTEEDVVSLTSELEAGTAAEDIGRASLLPASLEDTSEAAVSRVFGARFGQSLGDLPEQSWAGPVQSGYGWHLVRIRNRSEGELPPLDSVRDRVIAYWKAEEARKLRQSYTQALIQRVNVEVPDPAELL